jgi:hypothetical protein
VARADAAWYPTAFLSSPVSFASMLVDAGSAGGALFLFLQFAGFWRQLHDVPAIRPNEGQRWPGFGAVSENR